MLEDSTGKRGVQCVSVRGAPPTPRPRSRAGASEVPIARIVTPCRSRREFVATFANLVDHKSIFICTPTPLPIGSRRRFLIVLAQGTIVMQGVGDIIATQDGTRGPAGMRLRFVEMGPESRGVHEVLLAVKRCPAAVRTPSATLAGLQPLPMPEPPPMPALPVLEPELVPEPGLPALVPPPVPRTRLAKGTEPGPLGAAAVVAPPPIPARARAALWPEWPVTSPPAQSVGTTSTVDECWLSAEDIVEDLPPSLRPPMLAGTRLLLVSVACLLLIGAVLALSRGGDEPAPAAVTRTQL